MRIGQNPAKYVKDVAKPARVTAAVLNYIPFLSGFYAEALDVLKVCLESARTRPGSGDGPAGLRQRLVRGSAPVPAGRAHRRAHPVPAALGEKPGQGRGLEYDPGGRAGRDHRLRRQRRAISRRAGWRARWSCWRPTRTWAWSPRARSARAEEYYSATTGLGAKQPARCRWSRARLVPWETFLEFDLSLGQSEEEIRQRYDASQDVRLTYHGVPAFAGASHWQFCALQDAPCRTFCPSAWTARWGR